MLDNRKKVADTARRVSLLGMLFGMAMVLSLLEGTLPALPSLPPGIKLGLSNIVTMFTLLFLGRKSAVCITLLKALFVALTRGPTAAALSGAGGLLSLCGMILLLSLAPEISHVVLSVVGAVLHNIGQLCMAAVILQNTLAFGYLPIMLIAGVVVGLLTGLLLGVLRPHLKRLGYLVVKNDQV